MRTNSETEHEIHTKRTRRTDMRTTSETENAFIGIKTRETDMRTNDDTQHDLIGIKLAACSMACQTHEIAATAHLLVYGSRESRTLEQLDVNSVRRMIDRLAATIANMDELCAAVERDIPSPHRTEYAREMEVV